MINIINRYAPIKAESGDDCLSALGLDCIDKMSIALAIYGLPEMLENNALSDEEGMVPALQAAVERMEAALKEE